MAPIPMKELTMTPELINDLRARLEAARKRVTELYEARRPHALPAATGDRKAQSALAKLDGDSEKAERDVYDLTIALEEAEAKAGEALREVAERDSDARFAEAKEIEREIVALA